METKQTFKNGSRDCFYLKVQNTADFNAVLGVCMKEVVSVLKDALSDVRLDIARSLVALIFHHNVLESVYFLVLK